MSELGKRPVCVCVCVCVCVLVCVCVCGGGGVRVGMGVDCRPLSLHVLRICFFCFF